MFRITRGHQVQHIHFPLPVIRGVLDPEDDTPADRDAPTAKDSAAPAAAEEAPRESADG
jgi:hypothetical protein